MGVQCQWLSCYQKRPLPAAKKELTKNYIAMAMAKNHLLIAKNLIVIDKDQSARRCINNSWTFIIWSYDSYKAKNFKY